MPEEAVATIEEIPKDGSTEVEIDGIRVLLVRTGEEIHAIGAECPHAGGDLADGCVCDGHVRCPWHQARFDARTGQVEEPPSFEDIPHYETRLEDDTIYVSVSEDDAEGREQILSSNMDSNDDRVFVIVGGGAAAAAAAEAMREEGFGGRIVMITREDAIPYDRTKLSKSYLMIPGGGSFPPSVRSDEFYDHNDIEIWTGREVTDLDPDEQRVEMDDGTEISYDRGLIATGSRVRRLDTPGTDLDNIHYLHRLSDADQIRESVAEADSAVVVGASFIAMESAAVLASLNVDVTVVAPEEQPFARVLGSDVGKALRGIHEEEGIVFHMGHVVKEFRGDNKLKTVVLDDGTSLQADIAIVGIGVLPETDYVDGLERRDDGSVVVDEHMRATENLYAAGDIATAPSPQAGRYIRVEHWRVALQQGRVAGANMAGTETPYDDVPFFWTDQHGNMLRYVGHATDWDEVIVDGELEGSEFVAFYVKDDSVLAAAGLGRDHDMACIAELMRAEVLPDADDLREDPSMILP